MKKISLFLLCLGIGMIGLFVISVANNNDIVWKTEYEKGTFDNSHINEYNSDIVTNFGDIKDGYKNEYNNNKITILGDKKEFNLYQDYDNYIKNMIDKYEDESRKRKLIDV